VQVGKGAEWFQLGIVLSVDAAGRSEMACGMRGKPEQVGCLQMGGERGVGFVFWWGAVQAEQSPLLPTYPPTQ
jgi:hypothetical protein